MATGELDKRIAGYLNSYLFENVWNLPNFEYRKNIRPTLAGSVISTGTIRMEGFQVELPAAGIGYTTFLIPTSAMGGLTTSSITTWMTAVELQASNRVELRIHDKYGFMIPRSQIHVRHSPLRDATMIAIPYSVITRVCKPGFDIKRDIIVATNYDSDELNDLHIDSFVYGDGTPSATILSTCLAADIVYIDGKAATISEIADFNTPGTYIEAIKNENYNGSCSIDLAMSGDRRSFVSDLDGEAKTIIHIPKAANPDNHIISHNLCDILIFPRNVTDGHLKGAYLSRAMVSTGLSQITHNDIAIPDYILNSYTSTFGTDEFTLKVLWRRHGRDNTLIREKNYIEMLYSHDDDTILDFLERSGPAEIDFWTAEHLEASKYSRMIMDVPNPVNTENLPDIIDALGYFNTMALVSKRVHTVVAGTGKEFYVQVPLLFGTLQIYPVVSINGLRVRSDCYTSMITKSSTLRIKFNEDATLSPGDTVSFELFENLPDSIDMINVTEDMHQLPITRPLENLKVYEIHDHEVPIPGIDREYSRTYREVPLSEIADVIAIHGVSAISFKESTYGFSYMFVYDIGLFQRSIDIDNLLEQHEPIVIDLDTSVHDILDRQSLELDIHDAVESSTGKLFDPTDMLGENAQPAWKLMDGDTTYHPDNRWTVQVPSNGSLATYQVTEEEQSNHHIIGFRIGAMPNADDVARALYLPTSYSLLVDGVEVHRVDADAWYRTSEPIHVHMLPAPIRVDDTVSLRINTFVPGSWYSIDMWEPIFTNKELATDVPIFDDVDVIVHLNGYELVNDIDYRIATIVDPLSSVDDRKIAARQLVVTNTAYLQEANNRIDYIVTRNRVVGKTIGYATSKVLSSNALVLRWFDELSRVVLRGKLVTNVASTYGAVEISDDDYIEGAPFSIRTVIPKSGQTFLDTYSSDTDTGIIDTLVTYFGTIVEPPELLVLPFQHRITSLFLSTIIRDILASTALLVNDPSDQQMLDQLSAYDMLRDHDPALALDSNVDYDYVDVQEAYVELTVPNTQTLNLIQRIRDVVLADNITHRRPNHEY